MKLLIFLFIFTPFLLFSQNNLIDEKIIWHENVTNSFLDSKVRTFLTFENAQYNHEKDFLPFYSKQLALSNQEINSIDVINIEYEIIEFDSIKNISGFFFIISPGLNTILSHFSFL